ncbi:DgyrCDS11168 [Dimorphilus gyrociliatus]|uniref:DgyrCDS11168 n=1 Tax=Dimorphilus gyrociliatus TaxID=2664684 RepID=A0A7I8W507_9ANNE|nr:DgyrCDS11168 [Dimorphilus gyrociliatus]
MALVKKTDGSPNKAFFESQETINGLDNIKTWLEKKAKKYITGESTTNKSLSSLLHQFIQFQEDNFGKNASKPLMTKLPMKYWLDFKSGGAACCLFTAAFKFKFDQGWKKFDLGTASKLEQNTEMFTEMWNSLTAAGFSTSPKIYFHQSVEKLLLPKFRDIVKRHKGEIVDKMENATHIIHAMQTSKSEGKEFVRPVFKRENGGTIIHFWNLPDSYDVYSEQRLEQEVYVPTECSLWEVSADWLLDLDEYNEWMNEEDYLVDAEKKAKVTKLSIEELNFLDPVSPAPSSSSTASKKSGKGKRKRSVSPSPMKKKRSGRIVVSAVDAKKKKGVKEEEEEMMDEGEENVETQVKEVINPKKDAKPDKNNTLMDIGEEDEDKQSDEGRSRPPSPSEEDDQGQTQPIQMTDQTHHIIIPSYSAWFDYSSIHSIERRGLPEFFNGKNKSKTPEIYVAYRNFMIDTYRLNPREYLTFTACRRNLAGDVCCIMRVHAFLEQWGLVNYQVDGDSRTLAMGPPSTQHFNTLVDTPSGLQPVNPPKTIQDLMYGWFGYKPKFLQKINTPGWYTLFFCLASIFQSTLTSGLPGLTLSSIEKRFGISSAASSAIIISVDVSSLLCLLLLSVIAARIHRPRWLSFGLFLCVAGSIVFVIPHFNSPTYKPSGSNNLSDVCGPKNESLCNSDSSSNVGSVGKHMVAFIIGRILVGVGHTPVLTIALSYLDDIVTKERFSFLVGFYYSTTVFGPALGFVGGGFLLRLFTDFYKISKDEILIQNNDTRWIGAWWIGYLICGGLIFLCTLPLTGYPADMPGAAEIRSKRISEAHGGELQNKETWGLKQMPKLILGRTPRYIRDNQKIKCYQ